VDLTGRLISSIAGLAFLILLACLLRHRGLLRKELAGTFAWLVTHVTLPALIIHSLAGSSLDFGELRLSLAMFAAEMACLLLSWTAAGIMRLERGTRGAFILVSTFGSSALLGYALVTQVFPGSDSAMSDAVIISEIGVAPALFVIGVWVAVFHGTGEGKGRPGPGALLAFLRSPIFISLVLGAVLSRMDLPRTWLTTSASGLLDAVGAANTLLVAMTVGLLLDFGAVRELKLAISVSSVIKLLVQPLIALSLAAVLGAAVMGRNVLLLQTAMPAATLGVVFSRQYGCDSRAASLILLFSTVLSALTVPLLFILAG
jgi:predicted permease